MRKNFLRSQAQQTFHQTSFSQSPQLDQRVFHFLSRLAISRLSASSSVTCLDKLRCVFLVLLHQTNLKRTMSTSWLHQTAWPQNLPPNLLGSQISSIAIRRASNFTFADVVSDIDLLLPPAPFFPLVMVFLVPSSSLVVSLLLILTLLLRRLLLLLLFCFFCFFCIFCIFCFFCFFCCFCFFALWRASTIPSKNVASGFDLLLTAVPFFRCCLSSSLTSSLFHVTFFFEIFFLLSLLSFSLLRSHNCCTFFPV